jgi:nucleotide-binding universal stress UspA family protein
LAERTRSFYHILVAVDGSDSSFDAAKFAMDLAKKYDTQLTSLTVSHNKLSSYGLASPPGSLKQKKEQDEFESKNWFEKLTKDADYLGICLRTEMVDSQMSVDGTIVEYADSHGIDLIILGTRGRSGLKRLLLGSVAMGVVRYATCPVIVVK